MANPIQLQIDEWRRLLLDLTMRNQLIKFKSGRGGGVELAHPGGLQVWDCLVGREHPLRFPWKRQLIALPSPREQSDNGPADEAADKLTEAEILARCIRSGKLDEGDVLTALDDAQTAASLGRLAIKAREAGTELGINALFAAFGMLEWYNADASTEPIRSPLVLIPIRLERKSVHDPWEVHPEEDEPQRNEALAMLLQSSFDLHLPKIEAVLTEDGSPGPLLTPYFKLVRERIQNHDGWKVLDDQVALGIFQFQKLAMYKDLDENRDRIEQHPLCRGIAGDRSLLPEPPSGMLTAERLDSAVPASSAIHILDADSSQHAALEAVKAGANLVLDGPPGTGKSQTIANLVAEAIANGKTVLFVSEKAAALEVVKRRLDDRGLGEFCLELHSHRAQKKTVLGSLRRSLAVQPPVLQDQTADLDELTLVRSRLNRFVQELHRRREPLGRSVFEVQDELSQASRLRIRTQCRPVEPSTLDGPTLRRMAEILDRIPGSLPVLMESERHPWRGTLIEMDSLHRRGQLTFHLGRLDELSAELVRIDSRIGELGLATPDASRSEFERTVESIRTLLGCPLMPAAWLRVAPAEAIRSIRTLHELTERARKCRGDLKEFGLPAIDDLAWMDGLPERLPDVERLRLIDLDRLTLRGLSGRLEADSELLEGFRRTVEESSRAARDLLVTLCLGVKSPGLNIHQTLAAIGQFVLKAGEVPENWWDESEHQALQVVAERAAVQAADRANAHAELIRSLPQGVLDDPEATPVASGRVGEWLRRVAFKDSANLKKALIDLQARMDGLASLARSCEAASAVATQVADSVGLAVAPGVLDQAAALCGLLEQAIKLAPIHPDHWGNSRRDALRTALSDAAAVSERLRTLRSDLAGLVPESAYSTSVGAELPGLLTYRSWFRRLLPGWRAARPRLAAIVGEHHQETSDLLAPLERLAEWHRQHDRLERLIGPHRELWAFEADGAVDFAINREAIERASKAEKLLAPNDRTREILSERGSMSRSQLASNVEVLRRHLNEIRSLHENIGREGASLSALDLPDLRTARFEELRGWCRERIEILARSRADMEGLRTRLMPGRFEELTASAIRELFDRWAAYRETGDALKEAEALYRERLMVLGTDLDWESLAGRLKALGQLSAALKKFPQMLRERMSVCGNLDRQRLRTEVDRQESCVRALQTGWAAYIARFTPVGVTHGGTGLPTIDGDAFSEILIEQSKKLELLRSWRDSLLPVLESASDLPWSAVEPRYQTLRELESIRSRIGPIAARGLAVGGFGEIETRDWTPDVQLAGHLESFLGSWGRDLTSAEVDVITSEDLRRELTGLIQGADRIRSDGLDDSWDWLAAEAFPPEQHVSIGVTLSSSPLRTLATWFRAMRGQLDLLSDWIRYRELEREAAESGLSTVIEEVRRGQLRADEASLAYRFRCLEEWRDWVWAQVPELRTYETQRHVQSIDRFVELDWKSVALAPGRIQASLLGQPDRPSLSGIHPKSSEVGILQAEINKKRNHLPLRKLFHRIPSILPRLKPCLMMSPLGVSTYLQSRDLTFDLVVFDEASQVRPYDAISAIFRGRQLVVAGDQKQLPPTNFFSKSADGDGDGDDDGNALTDYESLLGVCCGMGLTRSRLRWHYRSRREALIAFSNRYFYDDELVTFPSVHDAASDAVRFEFVEDGLFVNSVNKPEARRVARLVLDHARDNSQKSLAVIAFSQSQQMRILDEIESLRKENPDLEAFFREDAREPFFVKNLENVQGDERDVVFLSVGYGPDGAGKVAMRFGPLNQKSGERRLNVAVTRAREGMAVISSIRAHDIDLSRTAAEGVRLMRAYLDFAESGPDALARAVTSANQHGYDSPFEREVSEEVTRHGWTVHRQVGSGGFRIDLAVVHPNEPGRYLLGIECDGASYHSSATARDRDRLRQHVLAGLGWHLCRVWSTDWIQNRGRQLERIVASLEAALKASPAVREIPRISLAIATELPDTTPPDPPAGTYGKIEEVPKAELESIILKRIKASGQTEVSELIQIVARELGFKRTGKNINAVVTAAIDQLKRSGCLSESDTGGVLKIGA